jgi:hypothetical protein
MPSPFLRLRRYLPAAVLLSAIAGPGFAAEAPPALAGVWILDAAKSDHADEMIPRMSGGRRPRAGRIGGMGGGPRGVPREGRPDGERRDRPRGPEMRLMVRPPDSLLIEQTDSTVALFEHGSPIEVLVVGPPQDRAATVEPEALHINATWSGRRLVALREDGPGGRASQQLVVSDDGRSFTLTLRREPDDDRPPIEMRRVYRRAE